MKIILDDRALESEALTLGDALLDAQNASDGRMVVQALADGEPIPAADLLNPPTTSPYAGELKFQTADPVYLVHETLYSAVDIVRNIKPRQKEVADMLLAGEIESAKDQLMDLLSGWLDVNKTVQLCTGSGRISAEAIEALEPSLADSVRQLASDLQELRDALASADYTAVSDLLAYEMVGQADRWGEILTSLADSLR